MKRLTRCVAVIALVLIDRPVFAQSYMQPHYDFSTILGSVSSTPPSSVGEAQGMSYLKGGDGKHPGYWQPKQSLVTADSLMTLKVFEASGALTPSGGLALPSSTNSQPGNDIDPAKLQSMSKDQQMAFAQQYMAKAMAAQHAMTTPMIEDPKVVPIITVVDSLSVVLGTLPYTYTNELDSAEYPTGLRNYQMDSSYNARYEKILLDTPDRDQHIERQVDQLMREWKAAKVAGEDQILSIAAAHLAKFRAGLMPMLQQVEQLENKLEDGKVIRIAPSGTMYKTLLTNAMKDIAIVQDAPLGLVQDALPFMDVPKQ